MRVFICYSRADADFVDRLAAALRDAGVAIWRDVDDIPQDVAANTTSWRRTVDAALRECTHMIVVLSPDSVSSVEVESEWNYFLSQGRPVWPVLSQDCDIPYRLHALQYWDMRENFEEAVARLAEMLLQQADTLPEPVGQPSITTQGQYYYPNFFGRTLLVAAEEVLGKEEVDGLLIMAGLPELIGNYPPDNLEKAFPFDSFRGLAQAIHETYGSRGAQAIGRLSGEKSFLRGMEIVPGFTRLATAATKRGPLDLRLKAGLELFLRFINTTSDQITEFEESDDYWVWRINRCANCWGWTADEPVCHVVVGVMQRAFAFAADGQRFRVVETECIAKGDDSCTFLISKTPIGE